MVLSVVGVSLGSMLFPQAISEPPAPEWEFEFCRTMAFQNGDFRDVYTSVVVNITGYDLEEMFNKIKDEHDLMNEPADQLTIRLYDSKDALKAGDCIGEKVFTD